MEETLDELSPRDGYASWASCYDDDGNPLIPIEGPAVLELAGEIRGRLAIDLGCGTGRHTRMLLDQGAHVIALDQSPEMMANGIPSLAGRPVLWVIHALPNPLPIASKTIDLAILGLVAEHIDDLKASLTEVARVLKPGGRCLISALHPDRTASGQRARFIDPMTGLRRPIKTIHRSIADYQRIAIEAGLIEVETRSLVVPPWLVETHPRAERYVGLNLGWVGCWKTQGFAGGPGAETALMGI